MASRKKAPRKTRPAINRQSEAINFRDQVNKTFKSFVNWSASHLRRHRLLARLLGATILVCPPAILNSYYQVEAFASEIKRISPFAADLLDGHIFIGILIACLWGFGALTLYSFTKSFLQKNPSGWSDIPTILLTVLDNIVGSKEQRFSREYVRFASSEEEKITAGSVFKAITKPSDQLNELIKGIYATINILIQRDPEIDKYALKVNLAMMGPNKNIEEIFFHYPSNDSVRSTVDSLNRPGSTIKEAVSSGRIVVIESILEESKRPKPRFLVTDKSRAEEDGSLICYPIYYGPLEEVVFVISIFIDVPNYFKAKFHRSYVELLKPFELRMKLEYALLCLEQGVVR